MKKLLVGDVLEVPLANGLLGYVQYLGKDATQLNSDIVLAFKLRSAAGAEVPSSAIIGSGIDFASHVTNISRGLKDFRWRKIDNKDGALLLSHIKFRDPADPLEMRNGQFSLPLKSKRWLVWTPNAPKAIVVHLDKNTPTFPGLISEPSLIIEQMNTGRYPGFYPDYE